MVVTKVEMLTKIKYKVYLDEEIRLGVYRANCRNYRIVEGTLFGGGYGTGEILQKVICKRAKLRAMHLLEDMVRSESALREKLRQGFVPAEAVEAAISYVKSFGYLDDARYAENFVQSRKASKEQDERFYISSARKVYQGKIALQVVEECFDGTG